jgi:hypothetical protein
MEIPHTLQLFRVIELHQLKRDAAKPFDLADDIRRVWLRNTLSAYSETSVLCEAFEDSAL